MKIKIEKNSKSLLAAGALCLLVFVFFYFEKKDGKTLLETIFIENGEQGNLQTKLPGQILLQSDTKTERVDVESGKIEPANSLESEDFSGFEGFPKLGDDGEGVVEQGVVLISQDQREAIVTVSVFDRASASSDSDGTQVLLRSSEYVCMVVEKKCQPSELLSQNYQGLDADLQKQYGVLWWSKWDSEKNLLFGNLSDENLGDVSPVYVCDTEQKKCQKTEGFNSLDEKEVRAVVPSGAFSPTLEKFVMINQYDKYNEHKGERWELLYYESDDLSEPALRYDISLAIDGSENVFYDSVYAVSWSQDEKKIAIATSHKIVLLDFATGKLQFVYDSPFDEEYGYAFEGNELIYTADGRFIVFAESEDMVVGEGDDEEQEVEVINVIKKIDLTKKNEVSELMRGSGLTLK